MGMFQFTYSLTEDDVKEDAILPLNFVKFQTVHSTTVSKLLSSDCTQHNTKYTWLEVYAYILPSACLQSLYCTQYSRSL